MREIQICKGRRGKKETRAAKKRPQKMRPVENNEQKKTAAISDRLKL
jgi:hypothetical protein